MIFDFLFKKEYTSCFRLEYGINFFHSGLSHCDMNAHHKKNYGPVTPLVNGKYDFDNFFKQKQLARKSHQNGIIIERCKGCYNLKKQTWDTRKLIKHIDISTNLKCNSDCIYCFSHRNKANLNKIQDIPVYEIIKSAIKKGLIPKECQIQIGGGEPVILQEFEDIINMLIDYKFNKINIYSSGIKYSPAIEKALNKDAAVIYISIDSGTKELYEKIKNTDKFDEMKKNVQKYITAQNKNKNALWLKYIIIPDINDNKDAIDKFFQFVKETGCNSVATDVEREWYKTKKNNYKMIENMIELMKYMEIYSYKTGIKHTFFPTAVHITNDFRNLYDSTNIIL